MSAADHRRQAEQLPEQAATTSSDYDKTLALTQANLHAWGIIGGTPIP